MAARSSHVAGWKHRLQVALTSEPQSTSALIRITAVPAPQARKLLAELVADRVAMQTVLPRTRPGGSAPNGFYLRAVPA